MSGYKQTVFNDDCVSFHTFDGDTYSLPTYTLNASPLTIIDERENQNPAILHIQSDSGPHGYRMGLDSLVKLEPQDQSSICFGYYGNQSAHPDNGWVKAYLEIPHSTAYSFPNLGEFTVELLFNKHDETNFRSFSGNQYISLFRQLFKKENVCNVYYASESYTAPMFVFQFPSGNIASIDSSIILNKNIHLCLVWGMKEISSGIFESTEIVTIDSKIHYERHDTYNGSFPSTNFNTSWEIAGMSSSPNASYDDRQTSPLYIDQFAVYDKALTISQIQNHYKKIYSYDDMIVNDKAIDYFPMNETNNLSDWRVLNSISGNHGVYYGTITNLNRGANGIPELLTENTAPLFSENAMMYFHKNNGYTTYPWFNINGDYAIEFWFKTPTQTKGVLFSIQDEKPPFQGIIVSINERANLLDSGTIEFKESGNKIASIRQDIITHEYIRWNDNKWHHCVIQRKNNNLELWLDATLQGSLSNIPTTTIDFSGVMYMMGSKPENLYVSGQCCKMARYTFALQQQQIISRFSYSKIYRIKGVVTLQGNPIGLTIRVMDNYTGELIDEITSDNNSGQYEYYLPNNNKVDLMIFSRTNTNVRPRAYGPIIPTGEIDFPITI